MSRHRPSSARDRGFTLVEVCIATMLLAMTAAGVAVMSGIAIRAADFSRVQTSAAVLASQKIEEIRSWEWTSLAGAATSPSNCLAANVPGWVDYLASDGAPAGTGPGPPATARFIRRWCVVPAAFDPGSALIVRVLVTTVVRDLQPRSSRQRTGDDALLATIVGRRQ